MMHPTLLPRLALAILWAGLGNAQTPSGPSEAECLAVLAATNAPLASIAAALRSLSTRSTEASIPVLQAYLASPAWSDLARGALETLDHPAASAALRQAAEAASGSTLAGLLDSLGRRRDPDSVPLATRHLKTPDAVVAAAAARTLGRIANEPAIEALVSVASDHPRPLPPYLVEALCVAADESLRQRHSPQFAARALAPLDLGSLPPHGLASVLRVRAAVPSEAAVLDAVRDVAHPAASLIAAHLVSHGDVSAPTHLVPETVASLSEPLRSALLIVAPSPSNSVHELFLDLTQHAPPDLRELAIAIAVRRGWPPILAVLWEQARDSASRASAEACRRLAAFPNDAADDFLIRQLRSAPTAADLILAADLLGRRAWAPAADAMLELTAHSDSAVRIAAWSALRDMVDARGLGAILQRWTDLAEPHEVAAAEKTLYAAVTRRAPDTAPWIVAQLSNAMPTVATAARPPLLRALQRIGGPAAVRIVADAAASADPAIRDLAARILIEWPDREALPWIEDMARRGEPAALRPLAVRAVLRWTSELELAPDIRANRLLAWETMMASEDDHRALLAALGQTPSVLAIRRLRDVLAHPNLVNEAASALLKIADAASQLPADELRLALEQARAAPLAETLRGQIERQLANLPAPPEKARGAHERYRARSPAMVPAPPHPPAQRSEVADP